MSEKTYYPVDNCSSLINRCAPIEADEEISFGFFQNEGFPEIESDDFDDEYLLQNRMNNATADGGKIQENGKMSKDGTMLSKTVKTVPNIYETCLKESKKTRKKKLKPNQEEPQRDVKEPQKKIYTTEHVLEETNRWLAHIRNQHQYANNNVREGNQHTDNAREGGFTDSWANIEQSPAQPPVNTLFGPRSHFEMGPTKRPGSLFEDLETLMESALQLPPHTPKTKPFKIQTNSRRDQVLNLDDRQTWNRPCGCDRKQMGAPKIGGSSNVAPGQHNCPTLTTLPGQDESCPCGCSESILCNQTPCQYHDRMVCEILAKYGITDLKLDE